ncbi:hypothetical protein Afer_1651 [Acidimicrobium ferrooxidans DSM 10331]|uniref:Uncharacterized protein n=1 Tax=Acidimicrobium ferrooxidans (strain DSM 10331 / JCM 15462 / NBRC 103882 / ICP) TaxID=525909 RepID=C7M0Q9_ACIFD|nr:hypothetical protein Afer_1651 [Acidimicrobium ferrooxidans DSM 10331]
MVRSYCNTRFPNAIRLVMRWRPTLTAVQAGTWVVRPSLYALRALSASQVTPSLASTSGYRRSKITAVPMPVLPKYSTRLART